MGMFSRLFRWLFPVGCAYVGYIIGQREDAWYRLTTSVAAIKAIATTPEAKLSRFLLSYRMFEMDQFVGAPEEADLLKDYYSVLNHLCAVGNFEKMYMPPVYDDKQDVYENQKIYERKMAHHLQVGPGSKVLDIGCGRGRVAHHVATYTGAHVTGLNIDPEQIKMAKEYAIYTGTQDRLDFILADYNHRLPFDDASLDAVYYVQVLSYHANITKFFEEVKRVLKPNGRVAFEDYVLGVNYDATNPAHVHLKNAYKPVVGGVETSFPWVFKAAVEAAGFVVTYHQDDSLGGWQYPLLEKERDFWVPLSKTVEFLYGYGIVPKIYYDVMERMTRGTDSLIEADKQKLISMGTVTFAHKPAP